MIPKHKMLKDSLLEELLDSKIARASLPRISACTCLKMNVMVKYRNKMKKSCSAYAFHKRIIQKLVDNRYAQKCCSAYAFSQKARLNQIPNQHANISKSCNEARLSPLPVSDDEGDTMIHTLPAHPANASELWMSTSRAGININKTHLSETSETCGFYEAYEALFLRAESEEGGAHNLTPLLLLSCLARLWIDKDINIYSIT